MNIKKNSLNIAVATVLAGVIIGPQAAQADMIHFNWGGVFSMIDPTGAVLANTDVPNQPGNRNNQFQTPVSGTLSINTNTGAGSATLQSFDFFGGTTPMEITDIQLQAIGDGMGSSGTLVLANMLLSWNGNVDLPASMVLDAAGLFGALVSPGFSYGSVIAGVGAIPATDGTYVGFSVPSTNNGYLALGPTPLATTAWNTSLAPGCVIGGCINFSPSGALPLVLDTVQNQNDFIENIGASQGTWGGPYGGEVYGIAGSPMPDGPFTGMNISLDFTSLTASPVCTPGVGVCPPPVPVPAAGWLFGSGLLGLIGIMRRRKPLAGC